MKIVICFLFFILYSCSNSHKCIGPNYNQGQSHNTYMNNRSKIVFKEDLRSKKQMQRTRKKASKNLTKPKKSKRSKRMFIS